MVLVLGWPVNNWRLPASESAVVCSAKSLGPSRFLTLAQYKKMDANRSHNVVGYEASSFVGNETTPSTIDGFQDLCVWLPSHFKANDSSMFSDDRHGLYNQTEKLCRVHHHACSDLEGRHGHHENAAEAFVSSWSSKKKMTLQNSR